MDNFCTLESISYLPKPPVKNNKKNIVKCKILKDKMTVQDLEEIENIIKSSNINTYHLSEFNNFDIGSRKLLDSFKNYVISIMSKNGIKNYHFCCNGKGFMINKKPPDNS